MKSLLLSRCLVISIGNRTKFARVLFVLLFYFSMFSTRAISQILVNFNSTSDLTALFTPCKTPNFTNIINGGIGSTGSVNMTNAAPDLWTTKDRIQVSGVGDIYTVSAFFNVTTNSGFGGLGFSISEQNEPDSQGSPALGLGMDFHGCCGDFINDGTRSPVTWGGGVTYPFQEAHGIK